MKTVTNKTKRPIKLRLPGGKTLFLGVTQRAQLRDAALEHPPVKKLLEAGDIEVFDGSPGQHGIRAGGTNKAAGRGHGASGAKMSGGDR